MSGANSYDAVDQPLYIPYMDLSGGLNTKKDPHALDRNQLATSVNTWYGTGNALSKRPGNVVYPNLLGTQYGCTGIARAFYGGQTCVIEQAINGVLAYARPGDAGFISFGTLSASGGPVRTAQMYDPATSATTTFIVDGVDTPKTWTGPGGTFSTVITSGTNCPYNHTNSAPITPKYVTTAGFYLIYAGEPTEPTAVYISNPYQPQVFNNSSTTVSGLLPNPYIPYLVGWNDGVQGGDVTGIERLADGSATGAVIVYKQSAIYRMNQVGFFGEMYWGATLVSSSVGCLSPQSIVPFDTFHCFLGIDGVYQTDGVSVRRVSDNVPTFFDSTLVGTTAAILNRTSAVATRMGQSYIIFFDDGNGTTTPAGYATLGVVFNFAKLDADGYPTVTTIRGMNPVGMVPMRGPQDDGNFVWTPSPFAPVLGYAYRFGVGSTDNGNAIATSFTGKADFMDDVFGPEAPLELKTIENVTLLVSASLAGSNEQLQFTCYTTVDLTNSSTANPLPFSGFALSTYGTGPPAAVYGTVKYTALGAPAFASLKVDPQITAQGRVVQIGWSESSIYPWTILGYVPYVSRQKVAA